MDKRILYIDMDGVIADFDKKMKELAPRLALGDGPDYEMRSKMVDEVVKNECPNMFEILEPLPFAIWAVNILNDSELFEIYFLSTPMSAIPESYMGKKRWINKYFGEWANKRLILTHRKDLCIGDILVDDRKHNGAGEFKGIHIHFGTKEFPDWTHVLKTLLNMKEDE